MGTGRVPLCAREHLSLVPDQRGEQIRRGDDGFGEVGAVEQGGVGTKPGERGHHVRGIAEDGDARAGVPPVRLEVSVVHPGHGRSFDQSRLRALADSYLRSTLPVADR